MKRKRLFIASVSVLAVLFAGDILVGGNAPAEVFRLLRVPRALTALLAGSLLGLVGAQMQAVFRNPLADPHIMGVSSGAGLGAAIVTLAGGAGLSGIAGGLSVVSAAAAGALLASLLIMYISSRVRGTYTLLIFGVMAGFALSAVTSVLQAWAAPDSLRLYFSWAAGSFMNCGYDGMVIIALAGIAGCLVASRNARGLDILLFGDDYAALSGVSPRRIRWIALAGCCLVTGAVTAFCGPLGFVGIVAPHIARKLAGTSVHRYVLPASLVCGGILGVFADIMSHLTPTPLPTGSTMALIGIPAILYIMIRGGAGRSGSAVSVSPDHSVRTPGGNPVADRPDKDTLLDINDMSIGYGGKALCSGITFRIKRQDCILLCGANGSGKTTLLRAMAAECDRQGKVRAVMIPSGIPKVRGFTLEEFIRLTGDRDGRLSDEETARLEDAMCKLRITCLKDRDISTLSDGEFQKGCIASALCRQADIILLDEPTAFLDAENRTGILSLLQELPSRTGTAVLFSTHDIREGAAHCTALAAIGSDRIFRISDGAESEKLHVAGSIFRNKNITFDP